MESIGVSEKREKREEEGREGGEGPGVDARPRQFVKTLS